jgi:hypothetical protein
MLHNSPKSLSPLPAFQIITCGHLPHKLNTQGAATHHHHGRGSHQRIMLCLLSQHGGRSGVQAAL